MKVQRRSEQIGIFYFWRKNADTGNLIFDKKWTVIDGRFGQKKSEVSCGIPILHYSGSPQIWNI